MMSGRETPATMVGMVGSCWRTSADRLTLSAISAGSDPAAWIAAPSVARCSVEPRPSVAASAKCRSGPLPVGEACQSLDSHDLTRFKVDDRLQMDGVFMAGDDPLDACDRDVLVLRELDGRTKHGDDEFGRVDQVGEAV